MLGWLRKLFAKPDIRIVSNTNINKISTFWSRYIGLPVRVLRIQPDGLLDVQLGGQPIPVEGVMAERFT